MAKRRAHPSASAANPARTSAPGPDATTPGPLSVAVRVRPGAGRTRVGGCYAGPHGSALIVAVAAPAVDGKATEAVRRALAEALGVRPAAVTLRVGATSRNKVFAVDPAGAPAGGDGVRRRLATLRDGDGDGDGDGGT
jgi:uncharacterized protein